MTATEAGVGPLRGTSHVTIARVLGSRVLRLALQLPFSLLIFPLIVHNVPAGVYGAWAGLWSAVTLAALADVGVRTELTRRVAAHWGRGDLAGVERELARCLTVSTATAVGLGAVALAFTPQIVSLVLPRVPLGLDRGEAEVLFGCLVVVTVVSLLTQTLAAVLHGVQRGDRENVAWIAALGAYAVVLLVAIGLGFTWQALLAAVAAQTLVGLVVVVTAVRRTLPEIRVRWGRVSVLEVRTLLAASGLLVMTQLSDVVDSQVDKLLLVRYTNPAHAAWYDVGANVVGGIRAFALLPLVVLLPGLAELFIRQPEKAARLYDRVAGSTVPLACVILGGATVLGPAFVGCWLGPSYAGAGTVIRLLSLAMLINALAAPGAMLAVAVGRARLAFVAASVNVAVNAVGSLVLVQHIGLRGALIGSLAGNVCATVLFLGLLRRAEPAHWSRGLTPGPLVTWAALVALGCLVVRGHSWTDLLIGSLGWVVASTLVLLVSGSLGELVRVTGAARQSFATAPVAADTPRSV